MTRALALQLCRKNSHGDGKQWNRWGVYEEEKEYSACGQTHGSSRRETLSPALTAVWITSWVISSRLTLASRFDLPGSPSIFGVSQDPPVCAHVSLSQNGFYWKGVWVEHPWHSSPLVSKEHSLHLCGQGGLPTSRKRNTWSQQGPASSLNGSPIPVLEFWFTGNESPITLPWRGGGRLPWWRR